MTYVVNSDHAEVLASGRTVAPGETVPAGAVDAKDDHDRRLLDEGVLTEIPAAKKEPS